MIANCGLIHFIMTELRSQDKSSTGYRGFLIRIAVVIQSVFTRYDNLFLRLLECCDSHCLESSLPHPITRKAWHQFYKECVSTQLDLSLVSVGISVLVNCSLFLKMRTECKLLLFFLRLFFSCLFVSKFSLFLSF